MPEAIARRGPVSPAVDNSAVFLAINSKVTIVGSVQFDGPIQIDGTVHGEVRCSSVLIAKSGSVEGTIVASAVTVAGGVNGAIYADKLVLKSDCDVEGEIYHREFVLEQGCNFEGKSRPHKEPLVLAAERLLDPRPADEHQPVQ